MYRLHRQKHRLLHQRPKREKGMSKKKYSEKAQDKIATVMREGYAGKLHSGKGPIVTSPEQMKAIALSEARERGYKVPSVKKKGR